jgi:chromosome segregation ATPase
MQKTLVILLIGMAAGMATCTCLQKRKPPANIRTTTPSIPAMTIHKQWQKEEQQYQQQQLQLQQVIHDLDNAYQSIAEKIVGVKKENQQLRQQVSRTIQSLQHPTDTLVYLQQCDSLQQQVAILSAGYSKQDTLAEEQVNNLQRQLTIKDETIQVLDARQQTVNTWLHTSLLQNKQLEKEITVEKKKAKRHRLIGTLKTIGLTAAAGWLGRKFSN